MKCNWRGGVQCTVSRVVSTELACLAWLEETEVCLCNSSEQVFKLCLDQQQPQHIYIYKTFNIFTRTQEFLSLYQII